MRFKKSRNIALYDDSELILKFQQAGENSYIGVLYKRYTHLVFGLCMKYLKEEEAAKDMVMQVFEKLLLKLAGQQIENFKSWLYVFAKNECLMHLRKAQRTPVKAEMKINGQEFMENGHSVHPDSEDELEEDLNKLETCIGKLNEEQQTCIRLFYLEKKSYQEIESSTGYPIKKVKSYIQNGRRNLKICVESLREQEA